MKHIVCYSGGHSSGLVALEVAKKYGTKDMVLLNHNISPKRENWDIKRFKIEVANFLGLPITYANYNDLPEGDLPDQFDVCMDAGTITNQDRQPICTSRLKTEPFDRYLRKNNFNTLFGEKCCVYYGFDRNEMKRINRRKQILGAMGYTSDYPLAFWETHFNSTLDIGIEPPLTYEVWRHANCTGCLKAGVLHWYVTYVHDVEAFYKGMALEDHYDYALHTKTINGKTYPLFLHQLECVFAKMKADGVPATEHQSDRKFHKVLEKYGLDVTKPQKPCECVF